jgi:hypothetical protein
MLPAHVGKKIGGGASSSGAYIVTTSGYAFNRLVEVLPLPLQISC